MRGRHHTDSPCMPAGEKPGLAATAMRRRRLRLLVLRRYLLAMVLGNLVWEFAHMPLYTIWESGSAEEIIFAALHCTGGDVLIALGALAAAFLLLATSAWPVGGHRRVAAATIAIGVVYTIASEWLNVGVWGSWAYRDLMPVVPVTGIGLSPIVQWIVLPTLAFWWAGRLKEPAGNIDRQAPRPQIN